MTSGPPPKFRSETKCSFWQSTSTYKAKTLWRSLCVCHRTLCTILYHRTRLVVCALFNVLLLHPSPRNTKHFPNGQWRFHDFIGLHTLRAACIQCCSGQWERFGLWIDPMAADVCLRDLWPVDKWASINPLPAWSLIPTSKIHHNFPNVLPGPGWRLFIQL